MKILSTAKSIIGEVFFEIFAALVVSFLIQLFITNSFVTSGSMEPYLMTGDGACFIDTKFGYSPKRGQVVGFDFGDDIYVKRIVGLPGETISFKDGDVYINGELLKEGYLPAGVPTYPHQYCEYKIPEDSVFLMGDNRINSYDARWWDDPFIKVDDIKMYYGFTFYHAQQKPEEPPVREVAESADWADL